MLSDMKKEPREEKVLFIQAWDDYHDGPGALRIDWRRKRKVSVRWLPCIGNVKGTKHMHRFEHAGRRTGGQ